jgi:hypothetical protein
MLAPHPSQARQNQRDALAAMIWNHFARFGPSTAGGVAGALKKRRELIAPRISEMVKAQELFDTGEKRRGGRRGPAETVWSTERGQSLLNMPDS